MKNKEINVVSICKREKNNSSNPFYVPWKRRLHFKADIPD